MDRILIIDDDSNILNSLSKILIHSGYEVEIAHDGEEGVRLFSRGCNFDCVVTDINMPRMNGNEVAQRIRNSERSDTPLIAMTGFGQDGIDERLFNAFLIKPFKLISLIGVIGSLAKKRQRAQR